MTIVRRDPAAAAELRATLALAAPLVGAQLLQMAVFAIDVIFVARLGPRALAASALSVAAYGTLMWALTGLVGAAAPLIAAELGRNRHAVREVRLTVRMAGWAGAASGLLVMLACQIGGRPLLQLTGQSPAVTALAAPFMALLACSAVPMILAALLRTVIATMGRPHIAAWVNALAVLVNALGNYALVFGHFGLPALGLQGSALASVTTSVATLAIYVLVLRFDRRLRRYRLLGRWWRPDWPRLRDVLAIGLPIVATIIAEAGLFNGAAFLVGRLGDVQLAAHTIALQFFSFAFMVPFGLGQAATIRVGLAYGAGDRGAVARAGYAALGLTLAFMSCTAVTFLFAARPLLGLYLDTASPANAVVVGWALRFMAVGAAFQLADGTQTVLCGALRGLQDTKVPMGIALAGYWLVGLMVAIVLGLHTSLGGVGVWLGFVAGLSTVALSLGWRWYRREPLGLLPHDASVMG